ncbi:alkaline phosphatase family protein [Brevibacillus humidisoli]|uniref:alkaline phosphatase family protein n=1 Tax=Brevibacillus humidisoli TaxID=2895522 RepID=UPI001E3B01D4|nr:alkaline phosphatase family protein [Brevibacillus humidisoli]
MSVTIENSLLTGTYADGHRIPGLLWYHTGERRVVNYGDGLRAVWSPGLRQWSTDALYNLNQVHLSKRVKTIHEDLHSRGFTSGSINGLVYRGSSRHQLRLPAYLPKAATGWQTKQVKGPDVLGLGALSTVTSQRLPKSAVQSLGFNDEYAVDSLIHLVKKGALPDLTLVYLPDMDGEKHRHGPSELTGVVKADRQLQRFLDTFGDWRRALREHIVVVMGDSGVTAVERDRQTAMIDLESALKPFRLAPVGEKAGPNDDVAIAINGRMSYVYSLSPYAPLSSLADKLMHDPRIDLIAWQEGDWIEVMRGGSRARLAYRTGGGHVDRYGNHHWDIRGDWRVMDLHQNPLSGKVESYQYPDGLRRLASVFHSHSGSFLVATAVPGAEFAGKGTPNHLGGGNHGSLHRTDAFVPIIVSGGQQVPQLPDRVVELRAYLLSLLTTD